MDHVRVSDNAPQERFEGHVDGQLAGFAEYVRVGDLVVFTHTEVAPAFGGQGVGAAIVEYAMDALRAEGPARVVARCSYVRAWLGKHPDYAELIHHP